jgi:hypothetical protein
MSVDYEQIESSQRQHDQYMKHYEEMVTLGEERILKFIAALNPKFSKDGNLYCYLYGDNLQEGIAGFGDTPYMAAVDFVNEFTGVKK